MDQFKLLKRRTTDLFNNIPQSLPSIQSLNLGGTHGSHHHHHHGKRSGSSMKGTWEKISGLPSVPRSSHSINIVAGNVYIFGGESADARKPVDNDMHVVALPSSGAQADYYTIKAKAAPPTETEPESSTVPKPEPVAVPKEEPTIASKPKPAAAAKPAPKPAATTGDDSGSDDSEEDSSEEESSEEESSEEEDSDEEESEAEDETPTPKDTTLTNLPSPRVGHATATLTHLILLYSGRGGPSFTPLPENGRVWIFNTRTHLWSYLDPVPGTPFPPPRSYHVAVATPKPSSFNPSSPARATTWRDWALGTTDIEETGTPQNPVVGNIAARADDALHGTFIIHGGCLADGTRTSDVWAFDLHSRVWQRLPDAPGPARGGTAMALSRGKLYRFGGFDGTAELGGQLDMLELAVDSFDDVALKGEVSVAARGGWTSILQGKEDVGYKESDPAEAPLTADEDEPWPGARSVSRLEAVRVGGGREYLVLILGERQGSGGGHDKAGKFWDDIWVFQVPAESGSVAGLADTVRKVAGGRSGEGKWTRVEMGPWDDEDDESVEGPGARGWIASAPMGELEENGIVVWGGVDEGNRRLGDGWILRLA